MKTSRLYEAKGYVNLAGYRRVRVRGERRLRMEHVLEWERHFGPVPVGMEIHHRNGVKLDNRIENLQLVTRLEHKRIHGGCELREGVWWKPCRGCGVFQPTDCYYPVHRWIMSICRRCAITRAIEHKRNRRRQCTTDGPNQNSADVLNAATGSPTLAPVATAVGV